MHLEAYTGLDIDSCTFLRRDVSGGPWGDDSYYDIKFSDEKVLEQIKSDTLWVKDSILNVYNYQVNIPDHITQYIKFDADSLVLYFEEHYHTFY